MKAAGKPRLEPRVKVTEIAAGDPKFESELIDSFLTVNEQQLAALESAIREEDGEEVTLRAHMINGSSSNAGAMRMQALAFRIEKNGQSADFSEALETFADLKVEFEQARDYLESYLNAPESSLSDQTLRIP